MNHTTTQHESTSFSGCKRLPTFHAVHTPLKNPLPLELRVFKGECTTEISMSTRLYKNIYPRIDKRRANTVLKDLIKKED